MPALQITINANGVPNPNGNGPNGARMSRTGANGLPNQVQWRAAQACTVTFPAGFFVGFESQQMVLSLQANGDSAIQTLLTTAPVEDAEYTITASSASGPPNPPMIEINS